MDATDPIETPSGAADLRIQVTRDGVGIASRAKTARATVVLVTIISLVALPLLLLRLQFNGTMPTSVFFFADALSTAAILTTVLVFAFGRGKRL